MFCKLGALADWTREKITRRLRVISPPKCKKRALENQKRAPENCHYRLQCKSLFNVIVNGMWKVACWALVDSELLPHKSDCNKSMKIFICTIFAILRNCQGEYFLILIKLPNIGISQNLELQDWLLAKCDQWWPFFSKGPQLRRSCCKQSKVPKLYYC